MVRDVAGTGWAGFDLLVLGGGTAALAAARAARRRGSSVVMVTDGPPGGDCTFVGCVPSKTLLAATDLPFAEAMERVRSTVAAVAGDEDERALAREGIEVVRGTGTALDAHTVEVAGSTLRGGALVIATGSTPLVPDVPGLDDVDHLTNETVFDLTEQPDHLAVLGGGAIGCELAFATAKLGTRVTLLESGPRVLAKEEPRASQVVHEALVGAGVDVRVGTSVTAVSAPAPGALRIETDRGPVEASHLLVAVGRSPLTTGTERLGLRQSRSGAIEVDLRMRTSLSDVYAAGDVTGRLPFTHAADEMGRVAVANALGRLPLSTFKESAVPWVTYTDPEVARIGLTEAQAARTVPGARVVEVAMTGVDRARTSARTEGFVKLVVGPRRVIGNAGGGKVLGATIVAPRAGEMIAEVALAVRAGMFTGRLAQTSHAYPTWSMGVQQAAAQLFGVGPGAPRPAREDEP